jgi:hypothetical protein
VLTLDNFIGEFTTAHKESHISGHVNDCLDAFVDKQLKEPMNELYSGRPWSRTLTSFRYDKAHLNVYTFPSQWFLAPAKVSTRASHHYARRSQCNLRPECAKRQWHITILTLAVTFSTWHKIALSCHYYLVNDKLEANKLSWWRVNFSTDATLFWISIFPWGKCHFIRHTYLWYIKIISA